jgi:hypothetical protein
MKPLMLLFLAALAEAQMLPLPRHVEALRERAMITVHGTDKETRLLHANAPDLTLQPGTTTRIHQAGYLTTVNTDEVMYGLKISGTDTYLVSFPLGGKPYAKAEIHLYLTISPAQDGSSCTIVGKVTFPDSYIPASGTIPNCASAQVQVQLSAQWMPGGAGDLLQADPPYVQVIR